MSQQAALAGSIVAFDQADAVGTVQLDDGRAVRFGASACAFEPVVGTRVTVVGLVPGFRGALKASALRLLETDAEHASRLGARDAERGVRPPTLGAAEHAALAREIGGLTVLLDEDVPRELGALLAWVNAFPLAASGIGARAEAGAIVFTFGGADVRAVVGHDPYPLDQTDRGEVGPTFVTGRGGVTLLFRFMPRKYFTRSPDAWARTGHARVMSRVARVLLTRGHAVILHRAGELVSSA